MLLHLGTAALRGERNVSQALILELYSAWEGTAEKYVVDEIIDEDEDEDEDEDDYGLDTPISVTDALEELEHTGVLEMDGGAGFDVRPEQLPGLCALYFDQVVRAELEQSDMLPMLLFKMLSL